MDRFLRVLMYFCCLLILRMTEHLQMFWPHFASICVPFLFSHESILTEHIFAELLKSDPSFFVLPFSVSVPASYHPFPVVWIKRLWRLHNGAICWSRPNVDSKPFAAVLEQNHFIWGHRMDVMHAVCEMHLSFTTAAAPGPKLMLYFTNSELQPATLAHLCWNREIDLYRIITSNLTGK